MDIERLCQLQVFTGMEQKDVETILKYTEVAEFAKGSPIFEKATLNLLGGPFTVKALNQGPENYYVQQAWLNGKPLDRCYLKLSEFAAEAELTLEMGPEPNGWASETRPPSFIS